LHVSERETPKPEGAQVLLKMLGSIVVLIHGGSLLADHTCGQGGDICRAGSAGGAY
jgi:hypothetical protein